MGVTPAPQPLAVLEAQMNGVHSQSVDISSRVRKAENPQRRPERGERKWVRRTKWGILRRKFKRVHHVYVLKNIMLTCVESGSELYYPLIFSVFKTFLKG